MPPPHFFMVIEMDGKTKEKMLRKQQKIKEKIVDECLQGGSLFALTSWDEIVSKYKLPKSSYHSMYLGNILKEFGVSSRRRPRKKVTILGVKVNSTTELVVTLEKNYMNRLKYLANKRKEKVTLFIRNLLIKTLNEMGE